MGESRNSGPRDMGSRGLFPRKGQTSSASQEKTSRCEIPLATDCEKPEVNKHDAFDRQDVTGTHPVWVVGTLPGSSFEFAAALGRPQGKLVGDDSLYFV